ncbi:MAG: LapA family protein [Sulfuricella denitrificans]|nr:LapA family protein [Sulfuricella denitrificans]
MQLLLIFGVSIAIGSVMFALQNNVPVTVNFAFWRFDSSLAMVLLLALGMGVVIAAMISSPAVIKGQWTASRLRRQLTGLEKDKAALEQKIGKLEAKLASTNPPSLPVTEEEKPYVGLKTLLTGGSGNQSDEA